MAGWPQCCRPRSSFLALPYPSHAEVISLPCVVVFCFEEHSTCDYWAVYGLMRRGEGKRRGRRRIRALPPPLPEGRRELVPPSRAGWTTDAWSHGWNGRRGKGHPPRPRPRRCGGRRRHRARPRHHHLRPRRWSDRWVEEPPLRFRTRRCGRQYRHRFRHPHCHFRPHHWNGCRVVGPPQRLHTGRLGREGRHRTRRPCHRLHPRRRRGRHRMDPLGITWGTRDRPAGGWCTREEERGEGNYRGTRADPPANRKAEAGGPRGGLGVSCRRRREMS